MRKTFPGSDLALWAAGATYFGVIGLVPLALVSLWAVGALVGHDTVIAAMDAGDRRVCPAGTAPRRRCAP